MDEQHTQQLKAIEARICKCTDDLGKHISDNDRHVEGVLRELQIMRENHLTHIQTATETQAASAIQNERRMANMEVMTTKTSTNQQWLMKYHWVVASAAIGALVTGILGLIIN